jgi:hypothetical protein
MDDDGKQIGPEAPPVAPGKGAPEKEQTAKTKKSRGQQEPAWCVHAKCRNYYDSRKWAPKEDWNTVGSPWQWQTCVLSKEDPKDALCLYCPKVCHP